MLKLKTQSDSIKTKKSYNSFERRLRNPSIIFHLKSSDQQHIGIWFLSTNYLMNFQNCHWWIFLWETAWWINPSSALLYKHCLSSRWFLQPTLWGHCETDQKNRCPLIWSSLKASKVCYCPSESSHPLVVLWMVFNKDLALLISGKALNQNNSFCLNSNFEKNI